MLKYDDSWLSIKNRCVNYLIKKEYVVLLAKFPLGTFETTNQYDDYNEFEDVHEKAQEGSYKHNYESLWDKIVDILIAIVSFGVVIISIYIGTMIARNNGYGYIGNKKIDKKGNKSPRKKS